MHLARQIIAALVLFFITFYIVELTGLLPKSWQPDFLIKIQLIPALLSGSVLIVIGLVVFTLITGRLYCSVICPLGILQDLFMRLSKKLSRKHKRKELYQKPKNILRYSILAISIIFLIFGSSYIVLLLDPYSIFGRFVSVFLSPIITMINNGLAYIGSLSGSYFFNHQEIHWGNFSIVASSMITLGIILYLNIKHERLWCNSLCPVGTFLGFISRFSRFKIQIDNSKCISCNACSRVCKSHCINEKDNYKIDYSRCISCFNCIDSCHSKAISYSPIKKKK